MASLVEQIARNYSRQSEAAQPDSPLGNIAAAPPLSQVDRIATTYQGRRSKPSRAPQNPAPVSPAEVAQQVAIRDAAAPLTTLTQRMAQRYGVTSATIPQSGPGLAAIRT
jgi:hypothetical protein